MCTLCQSGLRPTKMKRQWVHYVERRIIVCDEAGVKPQS